MVNVLSAFLCVYLNSFCLWLVAETAQFPVENVEVEEEHEEKNEEEEGRKLEEALNFYRNFQQKYRKETRK